ncbi:hypothetical protein L198_06583 [Cryptococcus wingfieldii CBS 7118]|uniref:Uncharacterized protein n=1 Tax=Cryptococcus wingfieldii CBS 7118 TaxID=1295528 RepID=A0A1E3IM43_9TREE|nr:hypothetical protein L198_06583 [Cryptococcus wingfieldii CBS 7118]ODN88781.1 hypothetical protein L198_06583 [Cryptococcus wingfieldii CBS 7118]
MSTNDAESRILEEATRAAEEFMSTLDSNLQAHGFASSSGTASRATVVQDISRWVKSAIEAEVHQGEHAEGWTEEDSLQNVQIRADTIGISQSGKVGVLNAKVQGDGWSLITITPLMEFSRPG